MVTLFSERFSLFLCGFLGFLVVVPNGAGAQSLATLQGRVADSVTGFGIEGAAVELDLVPGGDPVEFATESDAFGFFAITDIDLGTYGVNVSHPAYVSQSVELTLNSTAPEMRNFDLVPDGLPAGSSFFDVFAQVSDVISGKPLFGVPVKVIVFDDEVVENIIDSRVRETDESGSSVFRGMQTAYYRFVINDPSDAIDVVHQPKWKTFSTETADGGAQDKMPLDDAYMANILLEPILQSLIIQVTGFDPVTQLNPASDPVVPLKGFYVELTGTDEIDDGQGGIIHIPVTSPRTGVTDDEGKVTFSLLPAIQYGVVAKRHGYSAAQAIIEPNSSSGEFVPGNDPATPFVVNANIIPTHSFVNSSHVFVERDPTTFQVVRGNPDLLTGLAVQLQGLKDTNTEGIDRTQSSYLISGFEDSRAFFHLLPGRYRVSVDSIDTFALVDRYYSEDEYFDLSIGDPVFGGFTGVDQTITLEVAPAKVRGRLFAADGLGQFEQRESLFNTVRTRKPAYSPKQTAGVYLVEYLTQFTDPNDPSSPVDAANPADPDDGPFLPPIQRVISADTDESGLFSIAILPGKYGLRIPALKEVAGVAGSGYWGSHVILRDLTAGTTSTRDWPFHQEWPSEFAESASDPIAFESNHEYELDIFVRKQVVEIRGEVLPSGDPVQRLLANTVDLGTGPNISGVSGFEDLVENGGMATLNSPDGTQMEALFLNDDFDIEYRISNVVAGSHTLSLGHTRFTFSQDGDALPIAIDIPAWKGPGELPMLDPGDSSYIEPLTSVEIDPDILATYTPSNTVVMLRRFFVNPNPGPEDPEYNETATLLDASGTINGITPVAIAVEPDYTDNKIFIHNISSSQGVWPVGSFSFWMGRDVEGTVEWAKVTVSGSTTVSVHYGGTLNSFDDSQPFNTVTVHFRSVNSDDPKTEITGTNFTLDIDSIPTVFSTPHTQANLKGSISTSGIGHPDNWIHDSDGGGSKLTNLSGPEFTVTFAMRRSFDLAGTVQEGGSPIEGATVEIKGRFNNTLKTFTTDSGGTFDETLASEVIFVDITSPGYLPWRERYDPSVLTGDPPTLTIAADLTPIDPPVFGAISLDRFGLFLPGVNKSGNQDAFVGFNAAGPLTLTLGVAATPENLPVTYDLLPFDSAAGSAGASQSVELPDAISEIWIIDPRKFPVNSQQDPPLTGNPFSENAVPISPPFSGRPEDSLEWLQEIESGVIPNVFFKKITNFTLNGDEATAVVTIPLWELPPGDFDPVFAAVTRQSAITIKADFQYPDPVETHRLTGARMPPWMAFVADIIGTVSGVIRTNNAIADFQNPELVGQPLDLSSFIPEGRFKPLPEFTADIGLDEDNDGFLLYDYNIAVNVNEGMETPASGMMGLSPGILGLNLMASAGVVVSGHEKSVALTVQGTATTKEDIDLEEYLPKKLLGLKIEDSRLRPAITLRTSATRFLDDNNKLEAQLRHQVIGAMQVGLKVNLQPITSKIPYAGPVLLALDKAKKFQILGTLDGAISWGAMKISPFQQQNNRRTIIVSSSVSISAPVSKSRPRAPSGPPAGSLYRARRR